jgi:hypothetical protein
MKKELRRMVAVVLFSLFMAFPLGLGGLLGGDYVWSHYGPPANDPDETAALLCGLVVGGLMALSGGVVIVWKFWPRASSKSSEPNGQG